MADWPYNTAQWQRLRRLKLDTEPLCQPCAGAGRINAANTVDHDVPISAGGPAFPGLDGLTSMCPRCHGAKTARGVEAGAIRTTKARKGCDANGWPLDPDHPWNADKSLRAGAPVPTTVLQTQLVSIVSRRRVERSGCGNINGVEQGFEIAQAFRREERVQPLACDSAVHPLRSLGSAGPVHTQSFKPANPRPIESTAGEADRTRDDG